MSYNHELRVCLLKYLRKGLDVLVKRTRGISTRLADIRLADISALVDMSALANIRLADIRLVDMSALANIRLADIRLADISALVDMSALADISAERTG